MELFFYQKTTLFYGRIDLFHALLRSSEVLLQKTPAKPEVTENIPLAVSHVQAEFV